MKKGDRVDFRGRLGTVEGFMPHGMVDVRFDDAQRRVERRKDSELKVLTRARSNPRPARRNSQERQDREARMRGARSEVKRAYKPLPSEKVGALKSVEETTARTGAGFFTRQDEPRLSEQGDAFCGNPIDGTAYFFVVDNRKRWAPRFLTWKNIFDLAKKQDKDIVPNRFAGQVAEERNAPFFYGKDAIQALLAREFPGLQEAGEASLGREIFELEAKREELKQEAVQASRAGAQGDKVAPSLSRQALREIKEIEKELSRLRSRKQKQSKESSDLYRVLSQLCTLKVKPPGTRSRYEEVPQERWGERLLPGSKYLVYYYGREELDQLDEVFRSYERTLAQRRGIELIPVTERFRSYMRQRKPKGVAGRATQIRPELAGRQERAAPSGVEPDLATSYARIDPQSGNLTFYRLSRWRSTSQTKMNLFRPFEYQNFVVSDNSTLDEAVAAETGADVQVAQAFIVSGAVAVKRNNKTQIITDPDFVVRSGGWDDRTQSELDADTVSVWLKDKAKSPYFSWVQSTVPFEVERGLLGSGIKDVSSVCLSPLESKTLQYVSRIKKSLRFVDSAFGGVRSVIKRLVDNPASLRPFREDPLAGTNRFTGKKVHRIQFYGDVGRSLTKLAQALSSLYNAGTNLYSAASRGDKAAAEAYRILEEKGAWAASASLYESWQPYMAGGGAGLLSESLLPDESALEAFDIEELDRLLEKLEERFTRISPVGQISATKLKRMKSDFLNIKPPPESTWPWITSPTNEFMIRPALLWLSGNNQVHPADDLILFTWPSLSPQAQQYLASKRLASVDLPEGYKVAGVYTTPIGKKKHSIGVQQLRESSRNPERLTPFDVADSLMSEAAVLAQGGLRVKAEVPYRPKDAWEASGVGFIDPLQAKKRIPFQLMPPPAYEDILDRQIDLNWTVGFLLDSVYPALQRGNSDPFANKTLAHLLLLVALYYDMGGFELAGPLDPQNPCYERSKIHQKSLNTSKTGRLRCQDLFQIRQAIDNLSDWEATQKGGAVSISQTGNFSAYMTYNPVLFELTRSFWPAKDRGAVPLVADPKAMFYLDAVGRWGQGAELVQQAAVTSSDPGEVYIKLRDIMYPVFEIPPTAEGIQYMLRGPVRRPFQPKMPKPQGKKEIEVRDEGGQVLGTVIAGVTPMGEEIGHFERFCQIWPLGEDLSEAKETAVALVNDPLEYLHRLKRNQLDPAISWAVGTRSYGLAAHKAKRSELTSFSGRGGRTLSRIISGKRPPLVPGKPLTASERKVRDFLRKILMGLAPEGIVGEFAVSMKKGDNPARLAELEKEMLLGFQRDPGYIKKRAGLGFRKFAYRFPSGYRPSGTYDGPTAEALIAFSRQPNAPSSEVPSLFSTTTYKDGSWSGREPIYKQSALSRAEREGKSEIEILLDEADDGLKVIDRILAREKRR